MMNIELNDILELKKNHPCGGRLFTVMRTGMDVRIKCLTCGREMILPRSKVEKMIKHIDKNIRNDSINNAPKGTE